MIHPHGQEVIDHVEPLAALGIVHAADIDQRFEQAERIVAQEADKFEQRAALDGKGQLAMADMGGDNAGTLRGQDMAAHILKRLSAVEFLFAHRSIDPSRRIFFCSCRKP